VVPVDQRDKQPGLTRIVVSNFAVKTTAVSEAQSCKNQTMKGYYDMECKHGSRFNSTYSKAEIKRAWSN